MSTRNNLRKRLRYYRANIPMAMKLASRIGYTNLKFTPDDDDNGCDLCDQKCKAHKVVKHLPMFGTKEWVHEESYEDVQNCICIDCLMIAVRRENEWNAREFWRFNRHFDFSYKARREWYRVNMAKQQMQVLRRRKQTHEQNLRLPQGERMVPVGTAGL